MNRDRNINTSKCEEIFDQLKPIVIGLLKIPQNPEFKRYPEITMQTDLIDDLGVDSVETVDLVVSIEREFKIKFDFKEAASKRKIFQIVEYIAQLKEHK